MHFVPTCPNIVNLGAVIFFRFISDLWLLEYAELSMLNCSVGKLTCVPLRKSNLGGL